MINTRITPQDNQIGNPFGGKFLSRPIQRAIPNTVTSIGIEVNDFVNRALLSKIFGISNIYIRQDLQIDKPLPLQTAVLLGKNINPQISWQKFLDFIGERNAVVDLKSAIKMLANDGYQLKPCLESSTKEKTISVFLHNTEANVYPDAPRIKVVDSSNLPGFAKGDEFHFYNPKTEKLELQSFIIDAEYERFIQTFNAHVCGVSAKTDNPAIIRIHTESGAMITIMDVQAVNHLPENSGAEGPAIQVLIDGLGKGTCLFGKFLRTYPSYEEYIEAIHCFISKYPQWAKLVCIGKSTKQRNIWMLKIGLSQEYPAVLMSTALHSLEWAPTYGILRLVRFLLNECEKNSVYAHQALDRRQLCWVVCANPDGWETRDQEALGINLNRNFPSPLWDEKPNNYHWDAYNHRFTKINIDPATRLKKWGPKPGSENETQTLMQLLNGDYKIASIADFHEATAQNSFYMQHENSDGLISNLPLNTELIKDLATVSNGRFWSNANVMSYGEALSDFSSYCIQEYCSLNRLVPVAGIGSWQAYAARKGYKAIILESAGCDCTHYQTIRRSEYAAMAAEQILFSETGRMLRNPFGEERPVSISILRQPKQINYYIYDMNEQLIEKKAGHNIKILNTVIPAGGRIFINYS